MNDMQREFYRAYGRQRHRYRLIKVSLMRDTVPVMPGENSEREPPDSISNSEVKTFSADDSVGFPHVKVGHCQAFILKAHLYGGLFCVIVQIIT